MKQLIDQWTRQDDEDYGFFENQKFVPKEIYAELWKRKQKEAVLNLSDKKTDVSDTFYIEDDQFAIGWLLVNKQLGHDPFQADPPTRLVIPSPKVKTSIHQAKVKHLPTVVPQKQLHHKDSHWNSLKDSIGSISDPFASGWHNKKKSFENESDGYSDDFEEESVQHSGWKH